MEDTIKTETKSENIGDKEDLIYKLIGEKKALEAKNKRLASILELVTKKIAHTDNNDSNNNSNNGDLKNDDNTANDANITNNPAGKPENLNTNTNDTYNQIIILKKHINALKSTLEKTNNDEIKQLNTTISDFKSRFDDVENKLSELEKIKKIETKLVDIENSIILRKRSNDNPFGMLGTIGNEKQKEPETKKEKSTKETTDVSKSKKTANKHTKSLEPFMDVKETKKQKKETKQETISNISLGMKHLAEKFI